MRFLEQKILTEGKVLKGDVLKVDGFLNHRMDVRILAQSGKEIYEHFKNCGVNKILTVEASGIGLACFTAQFFDCPVLVAKKHKSLNVSPDVYSSVAFSFTHQKENTIIVSKEYLSSADKVLIVDDFLANGKALKGLIDIIAQAGASVAGASCAIEKGFQKGGDELRADGIKVCSLAVIDSMDDCKISFRKQG